MMDALISGFVEDIKKRTVTVKPAGDETDRPVPVYDTTTDSDGLTSLFAFCLAFTLYLFQFFNFTDEKLVVVLIYELI